MGRMFSLIVVAMIALPAFAQQQSPALDDQRVVQLVRSGVTNDEIIRLVSTATNFSFDLSPAATDMMAKAGVSDAAIKAMAARQNGLATPAAQPALPRQMPAASDEYISKGNTEIGLSGTVLVPHASTSDTIGDGSVSVGYYVGRSSLVGGDFSVLASNGLQIYVPSGFYRYVQHTSAKAVFPFVGVAAGAWIAHGGGTVSEFAAKGEAGIKFFVRRNVSFDVAYNLLYFHNRNAGFSDSTASLVAIGFALTF